MTSVLQSEVQTEVTRSNSNQYKGEEVARILIAVRHSGHTKPVDSISMTRALCLQLDIDTSLTEVSIVESWKMPSATMPQLSRIQERQMRNDESFANLRRNELVVFSSSIAMTHHVSQFLKQGGLNMLVSFSVDSFAGPWVRFGTWACEQPPNQLFVVV